MIILKPLNLKSRQCVAESSDNCGVSASHERLDNIG